MRSRVMRSQRLMESPREINRIALPTSLTYEAVLAALLPPDF